MPKLFTSSGGGYKSHKDPFDLDVDSPRYDDYQVDTNNATFNEYSLLNSTRNSLKSPASTMPSLKDIEYKQALKYLITAIVLVVGVTAFLRFFIIHPERPEVVYTLKLVSVFNRHGDRAPSDSPPAGDRHGENPSLFWPNGLSNLTELGKFREFKVGLAIRDVYDDYLGYNPDDILVLSSPVPRCIDSTEHFLRGLYNIEWPRARGRALTMKSGSKCSSRECLSTGSGAALEWSKIAIDTETVPSLTWKYLNSCPYRVANPSPVDTDLAESEQVRALPGLDRLRAALLKQYNLNLNFTALGLWSTIASEMSLVRTRATYDYTDHYRDWVNIPIEDGSAITIYDLLEQAAVIAYRDRVVGEANYIQTGQILTSLVESQLIASGQVKVAKVEARRGLDDERATKEKRMQQYSGKKMILYSSHDSVLQNVLFTLGIINLDSKQDFKSRFERWNNGKQQQNHDDDDDDEEKFLAGLKMSSYGMSVRVELWSAKMADGEALLLLRAFIYNRQDIKLEPVTYKPAHLGAACRLAFKRKYPGEDLDKYYEPHLELNQDEECPFDLFRNITADLMVDEARIAKLCK